MTDFEIGWTAGIIDGEGWLGLYRNNDSVSAKLGVANTCLDVILRLHAWWGGHVAEEKANIGSKRVYRWEVRGSSLTQLLDIVGPHLIVKRSRALVCAEFQRWRDSIGSIRTDADKKAALKLMERCKTA